MTDETKEYYRNEIERIAKKTKISEIYIAKKCLALSQKAFNDYGEESKKAHVGYYLISKSGL